MGGKLRFEPGTTYCRHPSLYVIGKENNESGKDQSRLVTPEKEWVPVLCMFLRSPAHQQPCPLLPRQTHPGRHCTGSCESLATPLALCDHLGNGDARSARGYQDPDGSCSSHTGSADRVPGQERLVEWGESQMEFSSLPLAIPFQGKGQIPVVLDYQKIAWGGESITTKAPSFRS